jgi:hypothetical protein
MEVVICLLLLAAPTEADQAARRILSETEYQTELPEHAPRADPERGSRRTGVVDEDLGRIESPDTLATVMRILWWIFVGVGLVVLLLWLGRELGARHEKAPSAAAAPGAMPRTAPPAPIDPEGLAAAGRYGEAIHALLLRVLLELRRGARIQPAWTSREVATRVPLEDTVREGLRALVHAVERVHFGGLPADEAEYRRCADDTTALLSRLTEGARA